MEARSHEPHETQRKLQQGPKDNAETYHAGRDNYSLPIFCYPRSMYSSDEKANAVETRTQLVISGISLRLFRSE